jgi:hypothetical protein
MKKLIHLTLVSVITNCVYAQAMRFKYYLNPTPNDRNIEFDPKQNLLKKLNEFEGVSEP